MLVTMKTTILLSSALAAWAAPVAVVLAQPPGLAEHRRRGLLPLADVVVLAVRQGEGVPRLLGNSAHGRRIGSRLGLRPAHVKYHSAPAPGP